MVATSSSPNHIRIKYKGLINKTSHSRPIYLIIHKSSETIYSMWEHYIFKRSLVMTTSHTRLKAYDHCNLRALIGRKGGDRPSSLHTRRRRPKGPRKTSWMKKSTRSLTWQTMDKVSRSPGTYVMSTSKRWAWRKFRETMIFFNMTNFRADSMTDKHHRVVLSNW